MSHIYFMNKKQIFNYRSWLQFLIKKQFKNNSYTKNQISVHNKSLSQLFFQNLIVRVLSYSLSSKRYPDIIRNTGTPVLPSVNPVNAVNFDIIDIDVTDSIFNLYIPSVAWHKITARIANALRISIHSILFLSSTILSIPSN